MFTVLKKFNLLRATRDEELYGLDIALHKTLAYPEDMMEEK
jgi:ammonia channel protein AmtB